MGAKEALASQARRVLGSKVSQGRVRRGVEGVLDGARSRAMNHGFRWGTLADRSYGMEASLPRLSLVFSPALGAAAGGAAGEAAYGDAGGSLGVMGGMFGGPLAVIAAARSPMALRMVGGAGLDFLDGFFGPAARRGAGFQMAKDYALKRVREQAARYPDAPANRDLADIEIALRSARDLDDLHATLAMMRAKPVNDLSLDALPAPRVVPGWHATKGWID